MKIHIDKEGWVLCPLCRGKTRLKIAPQTVIMNLPLWCPKCKRETATININRNKEPMSH